MKNSTISLIIGIIVDKLGINESEVTRTANFIMDLGADSLDTVELMMEFEREFNISIPTETTEGIQTVQDAMDEIEKLMNDQ